jgi:hypothetical protein
MAFGGVGRFSIEPGESIPLDGWRFGAGEDRGAQYFSANPTAGTAGHVLVMSNENKTRFPDGTVAYGFTVAADAGAPREPIFFDIQGGGFEKGFNGAGRFTIAAGESFAVDGRYGDGEDRGAQYWSANPIGTTGSMLVMSDQRKKRSPGGGVTYGFTVRNADPSHEVEFDVQGGGFSEGFNGVGRFTVGPQDTVLLVNWRFGSGDDRGAQYFSANPTTSAGSILVITHQSKGRDPDGRVFYGSTVENKDLFPVFFDVQGGGYI